MTRCTFWWASLETTNHMANLQTCVTAQVFTHAHGCRVTLETWFWIAGIPRGGYVSFFQCTHIHKHDSSTWCLSTITWCHCASSPGSGLLAIETPVQGTRSWNFLLSGSAQLPHKSSRLAKAWLFRRIQRHPLPRFTRRRIGLQAAKKNCSIAQRYAIIIII